MAGLQDGTSGCFEYVEQPVCNSGVRPTAKVRGTRLRGDFNLSRRPHPPRSVLDDGAWAFIRGGTEAARFSGVHPAGLTMANRRFRRRSLAVQVRV